MYVCVCVYTYIYMVGERGNAGEHLLYTAWHQVHSLAGFLTYLNRKSPTDVRSPFRVYRLSTPPPQPGTFPSVLVMKEMTRLLFLWSLPKHNSDTPKHLQAAAFSENS